MAMSPIPSVGMECITLTLTSKMKKETYKIDLGMGSAYFHVTGENEVVYKDKTHFVPSGKVREFVAIGREMGLDITKL